MWEHPSTSFDIDFVSIVISTIISLTADLTSVKIYSNFMKSFHHLLNEILKCSSPIIIWVIIFVVLLLIHLKDDVTSLTPTRLNEVVNRAGGRAEHSCGIHGWFSVGQSEWRTLIVWIPSRYCALIGWHGLRRIFRQEGGFGVHWAGCSWSSNTNT